MEQCENCSEPLNTALCSRKNNITCSEPSMQTLEQIVKCDNIEDMRTAAFAVVLVCL